MRKKKTKPFMTVMIILYIAAAVVLLKGIHPLVHALGKHMVTWEIGADGDEVKAVLSKNGVLTISGKGRTRDYTEETTPFVEYADKIHGVVIREGVTGIGDCLLYNCGNIKGTLALPSTVLWIGDGAFGGDSYETAPKFTTVTNDFVSAKVGRKKPGETVPETEKVPETTATPGNAGAGPGETTEAEKESLPGPGESTGADGESRPGPEETGGAGEESHPGPGETGGAGEESRPVPEESTGAGHESQPGLGESTGAEHESQPGSGESTGSGHENQPGSGESTGSGHESQPGPGESTGAENESQQKPEANSKDGEESRSKTKETAGTGDESQTTGSGTEPVRALSKAGVSFKKLVRAAGRAESSWFKLSTPSSAATGSDAQEEDEDETEETEEEDFSEDTELTNDLYEDVVLISALDETSQALYTTELLTSQILGTNIFYPGQRGAYECNGENVAFEEAAIQAGYRRASRMIEVSLDGTTVTVPVVDGVFYAPEYPEPEESREEEDSLFYDSFTGWCLKGEWESMGYEAPVYAPGTSVPVEDDATAVSLLGNWEKTCSITPAVRVEKGDIFTSYVLIDGNTGDEIPKTAGYQMLCQWQICRPQQDRMELTEGPADTADMELPYTAVPEDESAWEDIEGASLPIYQRQALIEDEFSYFRVKVIIEKQTYFRSASEPVTLISEPYSGSYTRKTINITYQPGDGAGGTGPEAESIVEGEYFLPKANTFTRNTNDGLVFTGWSASFQGAAAQLPSGAGVAEGAVLSPNGVSAALSAAAGAASPSITLTAQWSSSVLIYVNQSSGNDSRDGKSEATAVKTLGKAYQLLDASGTAETNIIQLLSNYWVSNDQMENSSYNRNVTIRGKGKNQTTLNWNIARMQLRGDLILQELACVPDNDNASIACNRNNLIIDTTASIRCARKYTEESHAMGMGVPLGTTRLHIYARNTASIALGPRGTSEDNPTVVKIMGAGSNIARVVGSGLVPATQLTTAAEPQYTDITIEDGEIGVICSGSVDGQKNGRDYVNTRITINGGDVYSIIGGQHANGYDGTSSELHGSYKVFINGGNVTTLYGGTLGRLKSNDNKSWLDTELNINDGIIDTIYGGGATGEFEGTIRIQINGGKIGVFYGGGYGKSPYIESGGYKSNAAKVIGSVETVISGGLIEGNVYAGGGGYSNEGKVTGSAVIDGSVSLTINGGTIKGDVYGGGQGLSEDATAANITGDSTLMISGGTIEGNVYGGGNQGSINGTASVSVTGNPAIGGHIYGGGNTRGTTANTAVNISTSLGSQAVPKNIFGAGNGSGTRVNTSRVTFSSAADLYGNVYGGGEQGVTSQSVVELTSGTVHGDVYGGGNAADVNGPVTLKSSSGSTVTGGIYGGSNSVGTISGLISLEIAGAAKSIYGAGNGASTKADSGTSVTISDGAEIGENVYGGGEEGTSASTIVTLTGGTIAGKVFGGGNSVGTGTSTVNISGTTSVHGNIYGGSNVKGEIAASHVTVSGSRSGEIFGGGFGTQARVVQTTLTADNTASISGSLYGGGEQGAVEKSSVILKENSYAKNVFGGGSQADVTVSADISVEANASADNLYGGSNNSGTVTGAVLTIAGKVTNAYGGGKGSQTIVSAPAIQAENGSAVTCLYGGGEEGQTQNGASVTLKSGSRVEQVFGGGNAAGVAGAVIMLSEQGSRVQNLYGGSNSSGTVEQVTVDVRGTVGGGGLAGTPDGPGAVYGGGLGVSTSTASPAVIVRSTAVITGEVFGGGAQGPITGDTSVTLEASSHVTGNVYAGGDAAIVSQNTLLKANDGSVIAGNLYGGGKGSTAEIKMDTRVIAVASVTGNVFGGGAQGAVRGSTHVDIAKGLVDGDGTTTGNVFGGSDRAKVYGNTRVHIGREAADGTDTSVDGVSLIIRGTVFGGGNTTDNGSTFDASDPFVMGNSEVSVEATGYDTANFNITKSIFGDGNMCTVKGSRTVRLKDYEAVGSQSNTSIQRADNLTMENCRLELTGAVDSANLVPTVAYSLNRIDNLIMKGGNTLKIQAPANLVKHLQSLDTAGSPVKTTATDTVGAEPDTKNCVMIQQGVQMELRTSEDVTTMEYGAVTGYLLLDVYDREDKAIESGIYVLGGYHADESRGGFLYGSGTTAYRKITPSTDGQTWRNWAIGTDMKRSEILIMSDKPAGGKIVQVESPWPADGSIYQLVPNSVEITTALSDEFILKDPAAIAAPDDVDTTLGITIAAGSQGWVNPMTLGYVKGSSRTGAAGNGFGGTNTESLQTLNNRSIKPMLQIELTNRLGVRTGDSAGEYPLTVQFKLENVKKLSDGSFSQLGTLTMVLQIRRDVVDTYDDILLSTGKEYVRGNQTYTFETAGGTGGAAAATISKGSSITLQYARKTDWETEGARDHRLIFSTGNTPAMPGSAIRIPEGTTIQAVDRTGTYPVYAHYTVPAGGVSELLLSEFIVNGTADHYNRTYSTNELENYLFVVDFAGAPGWSQELICVSFEPVYQTVSSRPARIVFNVTSDTKAYKLASPDATGETTEGKAYDKEAVIPLTLTTWAGSTAGVDTTGIGVEMGACLRLKNRDAGVYVPVPTDWIAKLENETYTSAGGKITIPLGPDMIETTVSLSIEMKQNSLPAGKYQWEIYLTASSLAEYPGKLTEAPLYLNFSLTDKQYSISADWQDSSATQLYPAITGETRTPLEWKAKLKADNGAATEHAGLKVILQRKDGTSGSYEAIDFSELFTDVSGMSQSMPWSEEVNASYHMKAELPEGTYRLRFELIWTENGVERTLTSDTENFIVTP